MPISWSDAVADADNEHDHARYQRALAQAAELAPLVESFIKAVKDSGKWPTSIDNDYTHEQSPTNVRTRLDYGNSRLVWASYDGHWGIDDFVGSADHSRTLVSVRRGGVTFDGASGPASLIASRDFDDVMAAMNRSKDWVPRELVGYLRTHSIRIPTE